LDGGQNMLAALDVATTPETVVVIRMIGQILKNN
jgi:hypothetical protein